MLEHPGGDLRLIAGEREDDGRRRVLARRQRLRERDAHQRRRIVEQHQQGAFGGGAVVGRKIGVEIGPRQRAGRIGALGRGGGTLPLQELTNDHVSTDATIADLAKHRHTAPDETQAKARALTNRSP